jgi:hypothetical protein
MADGAERDARSLAWRIEELTIAEYLNQAVREDDDAPQKWTEATRQVQDFMKGRNSAWKYYTLIEVEFHMKLNGLYKCLHKSPGGRFSHHLQGRPDRPATPDFYGVKRLATGKWVQLTGEVDSPGIQACAKRDAPILVAAEDPVTLLSYVKENREGALVGLQSPGEHAAFDSGFLMGLDLGWYCALDHPKRASRPRMKDIPEELMDILARMKCDGLDWFYKRLERRVDVEPLALEHAPILTAARNSGTMLTYVKENHGGALDGLNPGEHAAFDSGFLMGFQLGEYRVLVPDFGRAPELKRIPEALRGILTEMKQSARTLNADASERDGESETRDQGARTLNADASERDGESETHDQGARSSGDLTLTADASESNGKPERATLP